VRRGTPFNFDNGVPRRFSFFTGAASFPRKRESAGIPLNHPHLLLRQPVKLVNQLINPFFSMLNSPLYLLALSIDLICE